MKNVDCLLGQRYYVHFKNGTVYKVFISSNMRARI